MARRLARAFPTGFHSFGLSRGIDTAAQEAALEGEGGTKPGLLAGATLPTARNEAGARDRGRVRISEHPPDCSAFADFPLRNRIVACLSQAV